VAELLFKKDNATTERVATGRTSSDAGKSSVVDEVYFNESGSPIPAGSWVAVDITGTLQGGKGRSIAESPATADLGTIVGVSLEVIADDTWGLVRRQGIIHSVNDGVTVLLSAATDGSALASIATLGTATDATATSINTIGVCYKAAAPVVVEVRCI
jgi:hypothetical protein